MKITIVGTGYVGLVTGVCFADWGHEVLCVDNDKTKIDMLKKRQMPIYEDGLEEIVERNVAENRLRFTTSIKEGTEFAEAIFIAVGTPPGVGGEANLSYVEQVGRQVAGYCRSRGVDIADLAMRFVLGHETVATTLVGMSKVRHVDSNVKSVGVAPDPELLAEVLETIKPVANIAWKEGRPENDDPGAVEKGS